MVQKHKKFVIFTEAQKNFNSIDRFEVVPPSSSSFGTRKYECAQ